MDEEMKFVIPSEEDRLLANDLRSRGTCCSNSSYAIEISRYSFFLLQRNGNRVSQYFRCIVFSAAGQFSGGKSRAVASNCGPVILPRMVHGAIRTWGLFRIRLYFPESLRVLTYSLSLASLNQTGVGTATPIFLKVVRHRYF